MKVESMEIDNIEEWLRRNWEKAASPVMFAVAVGALFFAMCERNKWKASESPVPPARHGARQFFPQNAFASLFPQQLAQIDLQDGHAPTFYPPPPPLPKVTGPDQPEPLEIAGPIAVPFIHPDYQAEYPRTASEVNDDFDLGGADAGGAPDLPTQSCEFVRESTNFDLYLIKKVTRTEVIVEDNDGNEIPIPLRSRVELTMISAADGPPLANAAADIGATS